MNNLGEQIKAMRIAYALLDGDLNVLELSQTAATLFAVKKGEPLFSCTEVKYHQESFEPMNLEQWIKQGIGSDEKLSVEVGISAPERNMTWLRVHLIPYKGYVILQLDNIDELIGARRLNRQLSIRDPHTGLFYREAFLKEISRQQTYGTVCCVWICNYQRLNEIWGVAVANLVFMEFLARVQGRWDDALCAKHSTDSFNVFVPHHVTVDIEELYALLNEPFCLNGHNFYSNVALGYYKEKPDDDHEQSLNKSEMAILDSNNSHGRLVEFQEDFARHIEHQNNLETAMRSALAYNTVADQFYVVFQPLHDSETEAVVGAECLMRWELDGKFVSPVEFIPIAEKLGEISELTQLSITRLGELVTKLKGLNLDVNKMRFAINISVVEILDVDFVTKLAAAVTHAGLDPANIKLELTESALIDNFNYVNDVLKSLQSHGFRISIDDFGTGFSSLSYLCRLSFDEIKIDRAFVTDVAKDDKLQTVFNSVVSLAQNLGKPVVAEGVEDAEQLAYARSKGTQYIQGYYFSKPLKFDEFLAYVNK
ncbi:bifunctional diguanylate cyclase/phosphodiesterase [Vibrio sp. SCSIO 43136]|uniref:bifunctional diguanylate cyclase/phosphodiesterase n=1 Tax=Vibrio sp. SCSIO 43136 TaxID=2819101 RepID=UPI002074AC6E|nr:bifunctional diguanylate cyclase/phosphodiesterase [Vibrio sp. SCSIO 43136]USD64249.1 GGDEF domain-containing protein [Vibrio sp. SCSIO 43136]